MSVKEEKPSISSPQEDQELKLVNVYGMPLRFYRYRAASELTFTNPPSASVMFYSDVKQTYCVPFAISVFKALCSVIPEVEHQSVATSGDLAINQFLNAIVAKEEIEESLNAWMNQSKYLKDCQELTNCLVKQGILMNTPLLSICIR